MEHFTKKKKKGQEFVLCRAYEITMAGGSAIMDQYNWSIKRGIILEMSIILRQIRTACPWCKSLRVRTDGGEDVTWWANALVTS